MTICKYSVAERGVSEAIGFILIFTMVITGIGLVTLYGYPMLMQQQSSANERIMEKNMIVLQNDIKSLVYKTVPFKESSLKIEGGALAIYNTTNPSSTTTSFTIRDMSVPTPQLFVDTYNPGDLRYESLDAQTDISLQNGAVAKYQQSGSAMLAEPRWFYDETTNTWVINLIAINSTGFQSRTGIGTVKMALGDNPEYIYSDTVTPPVYIDYTDTDPAKKYSIAWDNYFQNVLKTGPPGVSGNTRSYELPYIAPGDPNYHPPRLVIKKYEVVVQSL